MKWYERWALQVCLKILTGAKNWKNIESETRKSEIRNLVLPNLHAALWLGKCNSMQVGWKCTLCSGLFYKNTFFGNCYCAVLILSLVVLCGQKTFSNIRSYLDQESTPTPTPLAISKIWFVWNGLLYRYFCKMWNLTCWGKAFGECFHISVSPLPKSSQIFWRFLLRRLAPQCRTSQLEQDLPVEKCWLSS